MSSVPVIVGGAAKDSKPSVIIGGVEKKIYDRYVMVGGVAKLGYKNAITLTNSAPAIYSLSTYADPHITNLTDSTNFSFYASDSAGNNRQTSYVGVYCRLPYTTILAGQQILRINGNLTFSGNSSYLAIGLANSWDYGIQMEPYAHYEWQNGLVAGSYQIDITITSGSTITRDGTDNVHSYFAIALLSKLDLAAQETGHVQMSIPWNSFTWLPTGDQFEYQ